MRSSLVLHAPAKINWSLYILNKRDDGYHNILSLMQCIGLYDTLTFDQADTIELVSHIDVPAEQNLVYLAADMLQKHAEIKHGARIVLDKVIPSGAGLGGGSSDAAYTLMGLNKLWKLGLSNDELKMLGSRLGSDVPFFFDCPLAIAEGRGEILSAVETTVSYTVLIIKPPVSIATPWAYKEIDVGRTGYDAKMDLTKTEYKIDNIKLICRALRTGDVSLIAAKAHNDFEGVVFKAFPVIATVKQKLLDAGALMAIMSGSGSTVFGLFEDEEKAVSASKYFSEYWHRVVATLT